MDLFGITNSIIAYFQAYPLLAVAAALFLVFLLIRNPKFFFILLLIVTILAGVIHLISSISTTGTAYKQTITRERVLQ